MDASTTAHQLTEDTTVTTPARARFTAPKGWWLSREGDLLVLEDQDRAMRLTLLETDEPDVRAAVAVAWDRARPGIVLRPKGEPLSPPPIRGWESVTHFGYEMQLAARRVAFAVARRFRGTTYVALVEGDLATVARREAQLGTIMWTMQPEEMREESFAGLVPRALNSAAATAELHEFVDRAHAALELPGAALAVVQGGRVVYERALGVRALGRPEPVTPETLFMIGSITKPMTTMMQAALVDAGTLRWDTPVVDLLPGFALGDPEVTRQLRLWHTSSASTGMPRRDMEIVFRYDGITLEDRIASMRTMKPTTGLGETFQYSNLLVMVGGCAAAHARAPSLPLLAAYEKAMQDTVFGPICMTATTIDFAAAEHADHAAPHSHGLDGAHRELPLASERFVIACAPSGAVWSNVRDMARYAMTEMAAGVTPDGARVASEGSVRERYRVRARIGDTDGYGLGIGVGTYRDLPHLSHNGGTMGFASLMWLLPAEGVGVVSLTNGPTGHAFNEVVCRKVAELLFDGARDMAAQRLEFHLRARREGIAHAQKGVLRDREAVGPLVARLAGRYVNPDLGDAEIRAAGDGGVFDVGEWKSSFAKFEDDAGKVAITLCDPPFAGLRLVVGGTNDRPTLTLHDAQLTYVFERV